MQLEASVSRPDMYSQILLVTVVECNSSIWWIMVVSPVDWFIKEHDILETTERVQETQQLLKGLLESLLESTELVLTTKIQESLQALDAHSDNGKLIEEWHRWTNLSFNDRGSSCVHISWLYEHMICARPLTIINCRWTAKAKQRCYSTKYYHSMSLILLHECTNKRSRK